MKQTIKTLCSVLALSMALTTSLNVHAAGTPQLWCKGTITQAYIDNVGEVIVATTWRNDYIMLCNMNSTWKGISPTTCAVMFSTALSALKSASTTAIMYFPPANLPAGLPATCAEIKTYAAAPAPYYLMIIK